MENTIQIGIKANGTQAKREIASVEAAATKMQRAAERPSVVSGGAKAAVGSSGASSGGIVASGMGMLNRGIGVAGIAAGPIGAIVSGVASAASMLVSGVMKFGSMFVDFVGKGIDMLMGLPKQIAVGVAAVAGIIYGTKKAMAPAAEMERYKAQLDVLGKNDLLPFFQQVEKKTPSGIGDVVRTGIMMETFQISSRKYFQTVADASAAFQKPMEEVVRTLAYAKSGRTGEAIESAGTMGVSQKDLKRLGIRFEKSGGVKDEDRDKVFGALVKILNSRTGGMSEKISQTAEGKESTLGSAIFKAFSDAGEKLLPMYKDVISKLTSTIEGIKWSEVGEKIKSVINTFLTKEGRAELLSVATDAWDRFGAVAGAAATDIGNWLVWGGKFIGAALVESFNRASELFSIKIGENFDAIWEKGKMILAGGLEFALAGIVDLLVNSLRSLFLTFLATLNAILIPIFEKIPGFGGTENQTDEYKRVKDTFGGRLTYNLEKLGELLPKSNLASKTVVGVAGDAYSRDLETQKKLLETKGKTSVKDIALGMAGPTPGITSGKVASEWFSKTKDGFEKATGTDEKTMAVKGALEKAFEATDNLSISANAGATALKNFEIETEKVNKKLAKLANNLAGMATGNMLGFDVPAIETGY
jgi:hypothetical protein